MLALLGNLSLGEAVVVIVLAVLIFGRRLPEVAVQAMRGLHRLRRSLEDLRRETGVDAELREMRRTLHEVERDSRVEDPLRFPGAARRERTQRLLPGEARPVPPAVPPAAAPSKAPAMPPLAEPADGAPPEAAAGPAAADAAPADPAPAG